MKIKTLLLCVLLGAAATGPAAAEDISYADAHGNLIVESDAGYKRIIVGQARNAPTLANYLAPNEEPYLEAGDRVFADSQGNVTIRAAAGYKRILVGRGDEARDIARQVRAEQAAYDAGIDAYRPVADRRHPAVCAGEGGVIKGRSYMYGLDKGETPVIVSCE